MRTSLDIDPELEREVNRVSQAVREKPAVVMRMALREGLPMLARRFQPTRPEGYFADDYPLPKDRLELEAAMARVKQRPDR